MATSQNGYPVLLTTRTTGPLPRLRHYKIADTDRSIYLRDGSAGFLLAHVAHWFDENIERIDTGTYDDWGWAVRPVRGQISGYSNHASGTAIDINATQHPRGRSAAATFSSGEIDKIHRQLLAYEGVIRWGGDYHGTPDGMHFEINEPLGDAERVARKLWQSKHGKPIIDANPGLAGVIWDGKVPGDHRPPPPPPTPAKGAMFDYSYAKSKVTGNVIASARHVGMRGAARYLSGNPAKDITDAERVALQVGGLWVLPVYEKSAGDALGGRAAGVAARKAAEAQAKALRWPLKNAIFYAVDFGMDTADEHVKVQAYFEGINEGNEYPVGGYGGFDTIEMLGGKKLATSFWQTRGWSLDSHGNVKISQYSQILQVTTHSTDIAGLARTDWDENLILENRPKIPVWNPGEAPYKPPPPPPPPPPVDPTKPPEGVSTVVKLVEKPRVIAHGTSDHDGVLWVFEMSSGRRFKTLQWNLQGTDSDIQVKALIRTALTQAGLLVLNECESTGVQNYIHQLEGWGSFLPDVKLSEDGLTVTEGSSHAWNAIVWNLDVWEEVAHHVEIVHGGVLHITPTRVISRVWLRNKATGEIVCRQATHVVHHIDVDGKARVLGAITGQNARARKHFAMIRSDLLLASRVRVNPEGLSAPVIGSGDLNVDFIRDRYHTLKGDGTAWFPYSVLGPVADILRPNDHDPTHTDRLIDWGWVRQGEPKENPS